MSFAHEQGGTCLPANPEPLPDKVVREFDVCLSSGVLGSDTKVGKHFCWQRFVTPLSQLDMVAAVSQLYLLQYPLRPPWRPYDLDHCNTVLFPPLVWLQ